MMAFFYKVMLCLTGVVCKVTDPEETYITHISWWRYLKIMTIQIIESSFDELQIYPLLPWEWSLNKGA